MTDCYLTFDDGPNAGTAGVLDTLFARRVQATFYLNFINMGNVTPGKQGDKDRTFSGTESQYKLVKRMIEEGHAIGDHGLDHDPMGAKGYKSSYAKHGTAAVKKDFTDNHIAFTELFKKYGRSFPKFTSARLPGDGRMQIKTFVPMITNELKLAHIAWNMEFAPTGKFTHVDKKEWQGIVGLNATQAGLPGHDFIILFHDAHWSKGPNLDNLGKLLDLLRKNNYTLRSLKDLPNGHAQVQRSAT